MTSIYFTRARIRTHIYTRICTHTYLGQVRTLCDCKCQQVKSKLGHIFRALLLVFLLVENCNLYG
jgi:hypothetical protein